MAYITDSAFASQEGHGALKKESGQSQKEAPLRKEARVLGGPCAPSPRACFRERDGLCGGAVRLKPLPISGAGGLAFCLKVKRKTLPAGDWNAGTGEVPAASVPLPRGSVGARGREGEGEIRGFFGHCASSYTVKFRSRKKSSL